MVLCFKFQIPTNNYQYIGKTDFVYQSCILQTCYNYLLLLEVFIVDSLDFLHNYVICRQFYFFIPSVYFIPFSFLVTLVRVSEQCRIAVMRGHFPVLFLILMKNHLVFHHNIILILVGFFCRFKNQLEEIPFFLIC